MAAQSAVPCMAKRKGQLATAFTVAKRQHRSSTYRSSTDLREGMLLASLDNYGLSWIILKRISIVGEHPLLDACITHFISSFRFTGELMVEVENVLGLGINGLCSSC